MCRVIKNLLIFLAFPTFLMGQKVQNKPVWAFDLLFDFAKSELRSDYYPKLDSLAIALQDSTLAVTLRAHTDAVGDVKANLELSRKRAESVKNYLISKNAPVLHIYTEGVGEAQPVDENDTDMGRQRNRRVSVSVMRRLAEVSGVVTDNNGKRPLANVKVVLTSKYIKDSAWTDENGTYRLTARLNLPVKIVVVPSPKDNCPLYDSPIFNVNKWLVQHNVALKCAATQPTQAPPVVSKKPNNTPKTTQKVAQKVTISGIVTNDSSRIVQGARLIFTHKQGRDTVFTDEKGFYSFSKMMYRDVAVSISASHHLPFYENIEANEATKTIDFKIQTIGLGKKATLKNINFYFSTHKIMSESEPSLIDLVQFMKENPTCHVEVRGHVTASNPITFPIGNIDSDLSYNRAKTIYQYLINNGVEAKRMVYKGYSNSEMVFPYPENEEEDKANRRVELKITRQ